MEHAQDPVYRSYTTTCRSLSSGVDALRIEPYGFEVVFSMHDAVCRLPRIPLLSTSVNKGMKKGRGCYTPALCYRAKDVAFWGAPPTTLHLVTWGDMVGVVPEPAIVELVSFLRRWSRGHTDVRVRCPTAILAPPLGECRWGSR